MRRINLPLILDTLFSALCTFLLFFTLIRYYTRNVFISLTIAIAACLSTACICFLFISRKQNKKILITKDEKHKKLLSLHLSLSTDESVCELFSKCLSDEECKAEVKGGKVYNRDKVYFFEFKMQPISEDDIAKVIKFKCEEKKVIFCSKISAEAYTLAENFLIDIKQIDHIYSLLKENKLLPEKYVYEEGAKLSFFKRVRSRFSRRICAPLFWSGLSLIALSYFTFFPIYYIASGGIMLMISSIALILN